MRCNNCGWDNEKGKTQCIKCESQLFRNEVPVPPTSINSSKTFGGTITGKQLFPSLIQEGKEDKILPQNRPEIVEKVESEKTLTQIFIACSNCNYLNSTEVLICSNCGKSLMNEDDSEKSVEPINQIETVTSSPLDIKVSNGTIDPYRIKKVNDSSECHLILVHKGDEVYDKLHTNYYRFFNSEDELIELNRDILEPNNKSITSKIQAELSFEDGKWYLQDKSEQETTFIRVTEKTELKEGDLILMGDRKFTFSTKKWR